MAIIGMSNTSDGLNLQSLQDVSSARTSTSSTTATSVNTSLYSTWKTFQAFDLNNDIIDDFQQKVTETIWSDGQSTLYGTSMFLNGSQWSASCEYYVDIYCYDPALTSSATPQFSLGFGDRYGRGSSATPPSGLTRTLSYISQSYSPSATIYSQYRNLLLSTDAEQFNLLSSGNPQMNSFYVINFSRNRLKERLDPGNWELHFVSGGIDITLIDDAGSENVTGFTGDSGQIYSVISGSIVNSAYLNGGNKVYMGLAYPDMGILLLNASTASYTVNSNALPFNPTPANYYENIQNFYEGCQGGDFKARNTQNISSQFYFVRVMSRDFNFSNNPSFTSGSNGAFRHQTMINNPTVYVTTVGLYDDNHNLLAVAKLSRPFQKNYQKESLIRVKLDF